MTEERSAGAGSANDAGVQAVAARALDMIVDGAKVGLGSGRAAAAFIARLGERVRQGLRVVGVPTSNGSAAQARGLGIPLIELDEEVELDLTVDGADEVSPDLDLVKGWGGALVRERIVAAASKRQVILVGREKLVQTLGERGRIPVEVIPLARGLVTRRLKALSLVPTVRPTANAKDPFLTDNGNLTLDCALLRPLADGSAARKLAAAVRAIPGVVDIGLFLGTAHEVLVGYGDGRVEVLTRSERSQP
ncbi:MAG TPA: ribose-5-phosphate isomerase RpiA [Candidatus Eisenbacteria bacterium]|nr:ribose-5-phosphate isomerase RpiA [Candidatus Eisenbacteria bacterium]